MWQGRCCKGCMGMGVGRRRIHGGGRGTARCSFGWTNGGSKQGRRRGLCGRRGWRWWGGVSTGPPPTHPPTRTRTLAPPRAAAQGPRGHHAAHRRRREEELRAEGRRDESLLRRQRDGLHLPQATVCQVEVGTRAHLTPHPHPLGAMQPTRACTPAVWRASACMSGPGRRCLCFAMCRRQGQPRRAPSPPHRTPRRTPAVMAPACPAAGRRTSRAGSRSARPSAAAPRPRGSPSCRI